MRDRRSAGQQRNHAVAQVHAHALAHTKQVHNTDAGSVIDSVKTHATVHLVAKAGVVGIQHKLVIAEPTHHRVSTHTAINHVVAVTAIDLVGATATIEGVVAVTTEEHVIIAGGIHHGDRQTVEHDGRRAAVVAVDEVITGTTVEHVTQQTAADGVIALTTKRLVAPSAGIDRVVARFAPEEVVTRAVGDGVVAVTAMQKIVAVAAFDGVGATVSPDRVVAANCIDRLSRIGTTDHLAGIAAAVRAQDTTVVQVIARVAVERRAHPASRTDFLTHPVYVEGSRAVATQQHSRGQGVRGRTHLDIAVGDREDVGIQVLDTGVAHHDVREQLTFDVLKHTGARQTPEVVEPVRVLQLDHLRRKHEVERAAQHAVSHLGLGQATQPQVNRVEAGIAHQEIGVHERRICRRTQARSVFGLIRFDGALLQRIPLRQRVALAEISEQRITCISHDEVDQRFRMQQMGTEIQPAGVRRQLGNSGLFEQLLTHIIQAGQARIAPAHDVQHRQVQGQANQVVAQRRGHPFVQRIASLARHAQRQLTCRRGRVVETRVQERLDQTLRRAGVTVCNAGDWIEAHLVDGLRQHRMAETVDRVGKLGGDRRVYRHIVASKPVDIRAHLAREFTEYQMLVLHLGDQLGGIEQHVASPGDTVDVDIAAVGARRHERLDLDQRPRMLGVENVVDGGQANVLVGAAIAGDEVLIEQNRIEKITLAVDLFQVHAMGNVVQECVAEGLQFQHRRVDLAVLHIFDCASDHIARYQVSAAGVDEGAAIRVQAHLRDVGDILVMQGDTHDLGVGLDVSPGRHAAGGASRQAAGDILATRGETVGVGIFPHESGVAGVGSVRLTQIDERRNGVGALIGSRRQHQLVVQIDRRGDASAAELGGDVIRNGAQRGGAGDIDRRAIDHQHTVDADGARHALRALDGGQRAKTADVGQTQCRGKRIGRAAADADMRCVGARRDHEVGRAGGRAVERIAWHQGHEDDAVRTLVHQIQAVVKELAEQRQVPTVGQWIDAASQRRQTPRRDLRVVQHLQCTLTSGGVAQRDQCSVTLVGHQVADHAWRRVDEVGAAHAITHRRGAHPRQTGLAKTREAALGVSEHRRGQARKNLVSSAPRRVQHVVADALCVTNPGAIRDSHRVVAGQLQLQQDEVEVGLVEQVAVRNSSHDKNS